MTRSRSFRPLVLVALVLVASLSCYLISLRVASERAALESVERDIAMITRDIRELETEIGTRGRLAQLERWNVRFLRLSAPRAEQFVDTGFHLANLTRPQADEVFEAPLVLASVERPEQSVSVAAKPRDLAAVPPARDMMQLASARKEPSVDRRPVSSLDIEIAPAPKRAPAPGRDPLAPIEPSSGASVAGDAD